MSRPPQEFYTLDQILNTDCADLGNTRCDGQRPWLVGPITCVDGTTLSVQASRGHYCSPRGNDAPFDEVEVGYPSADPGAEWYQHKDNQSNTDFNDVYAYVPIELVRAFIQAHAGEKPATEDAAKEGLDTCGYPGKWKSAKEGVTREKPDLIGPKYWEAVRTYFLELGGCYLSERCEPAPAGWTAPPAMPIIPRLPYHEPMKVRQG